MLFLTSTKVCCGFKFQHLLRLPGVFLPKRVSSGALRPFKGNSLGGALLLLTSTKVCCRSKFHLLCLPGVFLPKRVSTGALRPLKGISLGGALLLLTSTKVCVAVVPSFNTCYVCLLFSFQKEFPAALCVLERGIHLARRRLCCF